MATINDLNKSVSEMSDGELFDRIRDIRRYRRTPVIRKNKAKKTTTKASADSIVAKLSSTEVADLLKILERS